MGSGPCEVNVHEQVDGQLRHGIGREGLLKQSGRLVVASQLDEGCRIGRGVGIVGVAQVKDGFEHTAHLLLGVAAAIHGPPLEPHGLETAGIDSQGIFGRGQSVVIVARGQLHACESHPKVDGERLHHRQLLKEPLGCWEVAYILGAVGILVDECRGVGTFGLHAPAVGLDPVEHAVFGAEVHELYHVLVAQFGRGIHHLLEATSCLGGVGGTFGPQCEKTVEKSAVAHAVVDIGGRLHLAKRGVEPCAACGQGFACGIMACSVEEHFHFHYVIVHVGRVVKYLDEISLVEICFGVAGFDYLRLKLII